MLPLNPSGKVTAITKEVQTLTCAGTSEGGWVAPSRIHCLPPLTRSCTCSSGQDGSSGAKPAGDDQSEGRACARAGVLVWRAHLHGRRRGRCGGLKVDMILKTKLRCGVPDCCFRFFASWGGSGSSTATMRSGSSDGGRPVGKNLPRGDLGGIDAVEPQASREGRLDSTGSHAL